MKLTISPCPNDTFTFHALVHGLVPGAPPIDVSYADIDVTNTTAVAGDYDLVKVSYAALPWLLDQYRLLPCGGALGRGCGPLVISKTGKTDTIAIPAERSTAHLLMRLWSAARPPRNIEVVPFHQIMPGVAAGRWDAGLVIHEARFTYQHYGLTAIADLGEWWEEHTGFPIPLGAILAHRTRVKAQEATEWIRESVRHAWADPAASAAYVLQHAQEMEPEVVKQHIDLYVNGFTEDLGEEGYAAVIELLGRAAKADIIPAVPAEALRDSGR